MGAEEYNRRFLLYQVDLVIAEIDHRIPWPSSRRKFFNAVLRIHNRQDLGTYRGTARQAEPLIGDTGSFKVENLGIHYKTEENSRWLYASGLTDAMGAYAKECVDAFRADFGSDEPNLDWVDGCWPPVATKVFDECRCDLDAFSEVDDNNQLLDLFRELFAKHAEIELTELLS